MLFDRLVTGQVVSMNLAAEVRGHVVKTARQVLEAALKPIPAVTLRGLRDRVLLARLLISSHSSQR
jgi:ABC-type uncharacterized transport system YnjBCD ATPase subunit